MDNQATYDDVNLILKLYELRRDDRLREARKWFGGLKVKTLAELQAACPPGSEQDASLRMVTSYWEMAASFITSGVLNQELFQQSGGELLFVWTKIQDVVPEWRKEFNNPKYLANVETVAKGMIDNMNRANPKAYEAYTARVKS
ncbi:MAG TPA: hypothetical protein VNX70_09555 [Bryobacteraceae bacterium]|nr:hypothetical protein [Bryobacteraceae bacterium]